MTIKVGDKIPSVSLKYMDKDGMQTASTDDLFKGKKVVLFALPGAFTPTCSAIRRLALPSICRDS
jgi:glutaredoxin/glutathione-dependent peroxiredoxin